MGPSRRALHGAAAEFITLDAKGSLDKRKLDIFIGEPHQAFILLDREAGFALGSAIRQQTGAIRAGPASHPEKMPLAFHHDTLHFAHAAVPYPRVAIERHLPRQNGTDISPATLWLWGASHAITLDGTTDRKDVEK
ncbi:hypothetical protein E4U41_005324 [Claviceps citrina]|nr:hypothetical protein E4U41_005324 [Claviceps citrina]